MDTEMSGQGVSGETVMRSDGVSRTGEQQTHYEAGYRAALEQSRRDAAIRAQTDRASPYHPYHAEQRYGENPRYYDSPPRGPSRTTTGRFRSMQYSGPGYPPHVHPIDGYSGYDMPPPEETYTAAEMGRLMGQGGYPAPGHNFTQRDLQYIAECLAAELSEPTMVRSMAKRAMGSMGLSPSGQHKFLINFKR